ncbi:MAG: (d)CMP kinase [Armatimonadia bacterium]
MAVIYERLAIIGCGLIGGSVGLAARKRGLVAQIVGCARSEATRESALACEAVDYATADPVEAATGADLIYIAAPVGTIPVVLEQIAPVVELGCTVTDAGSVKASICREGNRFMPASFIGGHPMAGSEKTGVQAAHPDLFVGRSYILTPQDADEELLARLMEFVKALGAVPHVTSPEEHDQMVAQTSHLPHLWASALALSLAVAPPDTVSAMSGWDELVPFVGSGLRDTTRIAASDPVLWRDIFLSNRDNVLRACEAAGQALERLRRAVETGDADGLTALLGNAKAFREYLTTTAGGVDMTSPGLKLAIDGPAGAGKSTVARDVAKALGYIFIDTGAMYRAVAYFAMQQDLAPGRDDEAIGELAGTLAYEFRNVGDERHLFVDDQDMEAVVRLPEVGRLSSPVSAIPLVRHNLVVAQRQMAAGGGIVMEGRDIGTVVLPDAEVKVFLTATPQERARRRYRQLRDMGMEVSFEDILNEQNVRDQRDSSRAVAPLKKAADASEICSDGMSREEVVETIVKLVQERQGA